MKFCMELGAKLLSPSSHKFTQVHTSFRYKPACMTFGHANISLRDTILALYHCANLQSDTPTTVLWKKCQVLFPLCQKVSGISDIFVLEAA
jgi:hypothetical protein